MIPRFWGAVSIAALLSAACGGDDRPAAAGGPPSAAQRVDAATAGVIAGRVAFDGVPPTAPPIRVSSDPMCARANAGGIAVENYVVTDGGLDNVFVYVKDGLGKYAFDVPAEPVKLDQQGCRYVPRVVGVRAGQPIEIGNSDETMHNVHSLPDVNREFNFAQPIKGQKNLETFTAAEIMVRVKCDLHPWMNAYIGVVDHPYFAVTRDGGRFELKNVPPGTYTVEAWHEKGGMQAQQVTIGPKESKTVGFTYKSTAGTN